MTTTLKAILLAAPLALASIPADAAVFRFDLSGDYAASFDIDTDRLSPPSESGVDYFIVDNVSGMFGGAMQVASSIQFSTTIASGGLTIGLPNGDFRGFFGPQLFASTTTMPLFTPGQYTLTPDVGGPSVLLNVAGTVAAVPEPATWGMMVAGFAAVGFSLRRRKATVAIA